MTLSEYLATFGAGNTYVDVAGIPRSLIADLAWWAGTSSGAAWLVELMRQSAGENILPRIVLDVVAVVGLTGGNTLDEVTAAAAAITCRADAYRALVAPTLVLDRSAWTFVSASRYLELFQAQHAHDPGMQKMSMDGEVPDIGADLAKILPWSKRKLAPMKYSLEGSDCDDFAVALRGALAMIGSGDVMAVVRSQNHAFNSCLVDGTIVLIEPQESAEKPPGYGGLITGLLW